MRRIVAFFFSLILAMLLFLLYVQRAETSDPVRDYYVAPVDLKKHTLSLLWKDIRGNRFETLGAVKHQLEEQGETLLVATNAGIYGKDFMPLGLHVEQGRMVVPLNTVQGEGNFYLQPNGVFYVDETGGHIVHTQSFVINKSIRFATQSGPILLEDGVINPKFSSQSRNTYVRSGVGILSADKLLFILSRKPVSFYDMAQTFRYYGCKDALYLDGYISRMYVSGSEPQHLDGNFVGILAATEKQE